jgi:hypothetical protein
VIVGDLLFFEELVIIAGEHTVVELAHLIGASAVEALKVFV